MKKTEKWMPLAAFAALVLGATSCEDWGQQDPLAGNQTYPTKELVATHDFEAEEGLDPMVYTLTANQAGQVPQVTDDETKGKVLELCGGSYVTLANPLNNVALQKAASLTFWMYQPIVTADADGNEVEYVQDITSPIISFVGEEVKDTPVEGDESGEGGSPNEGETKTRGTGSPVTGTLYITANGEINYSATNGKWSENNPSEATTGYMTPGEWHYVAVVIRDDGFEWYVDGNRKVTKTVPNFDMSKLVALANNAQTLVLGSADSSNTLLLDDITFYRNAIDSKETQRPNLGGGDSGDDEIDFSKWVLVGNEDNTTPFWSMWSDYVKLSGDGTIHYDFYNFHGGKTDNWCNWGLVLATDGERGGDGYSEYLYLRADAYGWANNYNADNISHDFNWDTFMSEMDGAFVSMDIVRRGTEVNVTTLITAENGTQRHYSIKVEGVDQEVLSTFLTCEGSHIYINPETVFVGDTFAPGTNVAGATDFSSPFWGAHSELNSFDKPFANWGIEFINHSTGVGSNWNNWVLVCTNGPWVGGDGYAEQFVYRSDAYGWGAAVDAGNVTNEASFDWDTYVADMKDAKVKILFTYADGTLTAFCKQVTADGRIMPDYKITGKNLTLPMGLFFTVDGCWLEFIQSGYYPWATIK